MTKTSKHLMLIEKSEIANTTEKSSRLRPIQILLHAQFTATLNVLTRFRNCFICLPPISSFTASFEMLGKEEKDEDLYICSQQMHGQRLSRASDIEYVYM